MGSEDDGSGRRLRGSYLQWLAVVVALSIVVTLVSMLLRG